MKCNVNPEMQIQTTRKGSSFTSEATPIFQALADAFSCSLPENHRGDHRALDFHGELLCWWPREEDQ